MKEKRRAQRRKYHYIYKTICKCNNTFYYGMHSTDNLDDGYLGSGQRLWKSINKYGKENHSKEIIEYCLDRNSLKAREKEIVNSDLVLDPNCMNLKIGGDGGWDHVNGSEHSKWLWEQDSYKKMRSESSKKYWATEEYRNKQKLNKRFKGKSHEKETKDKIGKANSISQKGKANSQYGTCWICNENEIKKIKKENLELYLFRGYIKGRIFKK